MTTRNVKKSLIAMQDIAQGVGTASQTRGGSSVTVNKAHVPYAVTTTAEMQALDITVYTLARVYATTVVFTDYIFDPSATSGVAPNVGAGFWVPNYDTTANRPATPVVGFAWFDTTLGIPIWYDGTNWIDATGSTV